MEQGPGFLRLGWPGPPPASVALLQRHVQSCVRKSEKKSMLGLVIRPVVCCDVGWGSDALEHTWMPMSKSGGWKDS